MMLDFFYLINIFLFLLFSCTIWIISLRHMWSLVIPTGLFRFSLLSFSLLNELFVGETWKLLSDHPIILFFPTFQNLCYDFIFHWDFDSCHPGFHVSYYITVESLAHTRLFPVSWVYFSLTREPEQLCKSLFSCNIFSAISSSNFYQARLL